MRFYLSILLALAGLPAFGAAFSLTNTPTGEGQYLQFWGRYDFMSTNSGTLTFADLTTNLLNLTNSGAASSWFVFSGSNSWIASGNKYLRNNAYTNQGPQEIWIAALLGYPDGTGGASDNYLFDGSPGGIVNNHLFKINSSSMGASKWGGNWNYYNPWTITNKWIVYCFAFDGHNNGYTMSNNVIVYSSETVGSAPMQGFSLGARKDGVWSWPAQYAEIAIYSRTNPPLSRTNIMSYWANYSPATTNQLGMIGYPTYTPAPYKTTWYVATSGNDSTGDGSISSPYATIAKVQESIRYYQPITNAMTVYIRGGKYYQTSPITFGNSDGGSPSCPITYQAYQSEAVTFIGGTVVTNFTSVTDGAILARLKVPAQASVLVADLTAQAITDTGVMTNHGNSRWDYDVNERPFQAELLFNGQPMQLARYPNENASPRTNWFTVGSLVSSNYAYWYWTNGCPADTVSFTNNTAANPPSWAEDSNVWVMGYWGYDWYNSMERVTSIDRVNKSICLNFPGAYGSQYKNPGTYTAGQRFFYFNILEELDSAGEYYIDRVNNKLYFWPTTTITNGSCVLTMPTNIVTMNSVSNVTFSGITFIGSRGSMFFINGGAGNILTNCALKSGSADGIKMLNSTNSAVYGCAFSDFGERGVWFYGSGDRRTLTSGNNSVSHSTFTNMARLNALYCLDCSHTYNGVPMNEVGVYLGYNTIHDSLHGAAIIYGNENVVEYNEIYRVCLESADSGAIYSGYDPTFRGNVIRFNYLHDLHEGGTAHNFTGVQSVYGDAACSGLNIYGNIFANVDHGVFINGGRDNTVSNNCFVDITNYVAGTLRPYAVLINQTTGNNGFNDPAGTYWGRLTNIPYQGVLWSNKYPTLAIITNAGPYLPSTNACIATNNVLVNNICYNYNTDISYPYNGNPYYATCFKGADTAAGAYPGQAAYLTNAVVLNNVTNADPLFLDYAGRNFYLQDASPALATGYKQIPYWTFPPPPPPGAVSIRAVNANIGSARSAP